jgi:energy-coupling factor transporter ATP-binding protein EcfA2
MSVSGNQMELREEELRKHYPAALGLLEGFDHTPRIARPKAEPGAERSPGIRRSRAFRSTTPGLVTRSTARPEGVRLIERVEGLGEDALPGPEQASVLQALRRALAIALAMGEAYAERTGLDVLKRDNLAGGLAAERRREFSDLLAAEALVATAVFANAAGFLLAPLAGSAAVEIGAVEEVLTDNAQLALQGALWELDQELATFAGADPARLVPVVLAFAEQLMEKVALRAQAAPRLEPFTGASWRVEADDLTIQGFTPARRGRGGALTMQFKKPHQVVGNHIAKYQAMKLAKMLMAYDFERRLNPFAELGGFIFTFMGDGKPGTGKTTLIQMMAGLIHGYCEVAGYPFRYQNFSIDQIDSYQGKSGQNARAFIDNVMDPAVIGFGTVDDIDQVAGKRGDRQSSAGQQEVTAVLMEAFSGANTVVRGNCSFGMFSNYPENVDDALRQRAGARFLVDGPQTRADYIDILALLLGKRHDIPLGEHDLYAAQAIERAVAASYDSHGVPHEEGLRAVWDRVAASVGPLDTIAKLGSYLKAIQEADARFTGRAIKNITDAVKVRALDVELPDAWMEEPELFLFRDYETKLGMIGELTRPITVEMVIQEINRYADSEFRYADKSDEAAIETAVREMGRMEEARRRYAERRDG